MKTAPILALLMTTACGGKDILDEYRPVFADDDRTHVAYVHTRWSGDTDCLGVCLPAVHRSIAFQRLYLVTADQDGWIEEADGDPLVELGTDVPVGGALYVRSHGYLVVGSGFGDSPPLRVSLDGSVVEIEGPDGRFMPRVVPSRAGDVLAVTSTGFRDGSGASQYHFLDASTLERLNTEPPHSGTNWFVWTDDGRVLVRDGAGGEDVRDTVSTIDPITGAIEPAVVDRCYTDVTRSSLEASDGRELTPEFYEFPVQATDFLPETCLFDVAE